MKYVIASCFLLIGFVIAFEIRRYFKNRKIPRWIEAETTEIDDPVLGRCIVRLPVVGQNQSKGFVECTHEIDGEPVEFCNDFIDDTGTSGLDESILDLRSYYLLATNSEQMKIFKNAIPSQLKMHNNLFPESSMSESELKSTSKLWSVMPMGNDQAWFRFSSKKFMQGRPIFVTVNKNGDVESVGVG